MLFMAGKSLPMFSSICLSARCQPLIFLNNYNSQMASKYRRKFEMPQGFYQLLEDYSREVLRNQPADIVEFSYLYFQALENVRVLKLNLQ